MRGLVVNLLYARDWDGGGEGGIEALALVGVGEVVVGGFYQSLLVP